MRNLKKILALVLALVMSLSLMATAGAGSFQDVTDDNPYKTAIDVLDELKVFQGFEDGTFKPTDTLTRAQAAVLVYRIATGDVENKYLDNYTYMQQSKFTDLDGYNWAKGYINYCQNAGIVVGTDATHFNPGGQVTGYQLLVMLLRTLGYGKAGEFTDPKGWELQTAAIAEREGILKNVTGGDFEHAAPRQMVAEILFRGLLTETVTYSALTSGGYTPSGETLGKRELGLEEVTGVVIANEYADLYDTDTLAEGKTKLQDGDETYTVNHSTGLDDIGESRLVYLQNGTKVLSIADSGKNNKAESTDVEKNLNDLFSEAGIDSRAKDSECFINFAYAGEYTTPYRIRYVLKYEDGYLVGTKLKAEDMRSAIITADGANKSGSAVDVAPRTAIGTTAADDGEISVTIRPDSVVTDMDLLWMEYIFSDGDKNTAAGYDVGEIYVNTQSTTDISDDPDYHYQKFVDTFMEYTENATAVSKNENGNWLKVIDNDGDGEADYILKVVYTGAQVERIKDDKITLDVKEHALTDGDSLNTLTSQKVANESEDDLAEGDIVYYAIIDKVARTYKADMVTATIDKINRNTKSTTTEDGTEYFESGVHNHVQDEVFESEVTNLVGKVSFDLYFDRGGYLMTFVKSNRNGDFKLVTDGWFNSTKSGYEYAVRVYNDDEAKQEVIDLTSGGSLFIDGRVSNGTNQVQNNDWLALKYLGGATVAGGALNDSPVGALNGSTSRTENRIKTTVASIGEDGAILPVDNYAITGRYNHMMIDIPTNKIPSSAYIAGQAYDTTSGSDTAYNHTITSPTTGYADYENVELRALSTTKYYVVWPANSSNTSVGVQAFTGYSKVGDITKLVSSRTNTKDLSLVEDIYAVGKWTSKDNVTGTNYYTADIVVIELNAAPTNARTMVLLTDDEGQVDRTGLRHVQVIMPDGSTEWIDVNSYPTDSDHLKAKNRYEEKIQPGLYFLSENGEEVYKLEAMTAADIRDAECFINGQVQYYAGVHSSDYVVVNPATVNGVDYAPTSTKQPIITENSKFYTLGYNVSNSNGYREEAADLSEEGAKDYRDVLAGRVEGVPTNSSYASVRDYDDLNDKNSYFLNDVLIRVNGDNQIVWAVSFQNVYDDNKTDFAQTVWADTAPAAKGPATVDPNPSYLYNVIVKQVGPNGEELGTKKFGTNTPGGSVTFDADDLKIEGYAFDPDTGLKNEYGTVVADDANGNWIVTGLTANRTWIATYTAVAPQLTLVATNLAPDVVASADLVKQWDAAANRWTDDTTTYTYGGEYKVRFALNNLYDYAAAFTASGDGTVVGPTTEVIDGTAYTVFTGKIYKTSSLTLTKTAKDKAEVLVNAGAGVIVNFQTPAAAATGSTPLAQIDASNGAITGSSGAAGDAGDVFVNTDIVFQVDDTAVASGKRVSSVGYKVTTGSSFTTIPVGDNGYYTVPKSAVTTDGVTIEVKVVDDAPTVTLTKNGGITTEKADSASGPWTALSGATFTVAYSTGVAYVKTSAPAYMVVSGSNATATPDSTNTIFTITGVDGDTAIAINPLPSVPEANAATAAAAGCTGLENYLVPAENISVTRTGATELTVSVDVPYAKTNSATSPANYPGFGANGEAVVAAAKALNPSFGGGATVEKFAFYAIKVWNGTSVDTVIMVVAPGTERGRFTSNGTTYTVVYEDLTFE